MTRVITLDPDQRERMIAILGSILDNEHDKRKMGDDFQVLVHLTDDQLVNIEVRCNWLSDPARNGNVEMIVEDWLADMIVDYGEEHRYRRPRSAPCCSHRSVIPCAGAT